MGLSHQLIPNVQAQLGTRRKLAFESKLVILESLTVENDWHVWSCIWGVDVLASNRKWGLSAALEERIAWC